MRWIGKTKFKELIPGTKVRIRYMLGDAYVTGSPEVKGKKDIHGNIIPQDVIRIRFESGPWQGKELELVRQQIEKVL